MFDGIIHGNSEVLPEETPDALREEVLADVGVDGGEGVVEQVGVGLPVHSPS